MTDRNELNEKTDDELRGIAHDLGVFVHHNSKREKIINTIMDAIVPAGEAQHFRMGVKEDTGNVNIPLQNIRRCADLVCKPAKAPTAQKP
jgi:hypothetical protein